MVTVKGAIPPGEAGITDAHNHLWIGRVEGASPDGPVLDDGEAIAAELVDYRQAGGRTIIDCQPGGCGRDAKVLHQLSQGGNVHIVAREATLEETPVWLLEAAAQACQDTGAAMEVHTERGSQSEQTITLLQEFGLQLQRVVLCHMDKRPAVEGLVGGNIAGRLARPSAKEYAVGRRG